MTSTSSKPRLIGAEELRAALDMAGAVGALHGALAGGLDPEADPPRAVAAVPAGQLLQMPAAAGRYAGVKIAGVAPGNPARGLPRITGAYLLLDGATLHVLAVLDGPVLTALRTPAVSAVAVAALTADRPLEVLVYGTGPQAYGHVEAVRAVREIAGVRIAGRRGEAVAALAGWCRERGIRAEPAGRDAVAEADLIVCCTSARQPLFDGAAVAGHATVVAMGSHQPEYAEVDQELVRRATICVESRAAALREAGDLLRAGVDGSTPMLNLAELVRTGPGAGGPSLFKSVGMAWEDLVVASAVYDRLR